MTQTTVSENSIPKPFLRELEKQLIHLAASGNTNSATWLKYGSSFFMSGLAVLLASARRDFDREKYLELAEELHPGMTEPAVFKHWLKLTPVRAARLLPKVRRHQRGLHHQIDAAATSKL